MITDEQWEELCVWSGFQQKWTSDWDRRSYKEWRHSIGKYKGLPYMSSKLPEKDMNSLVRWFIPKLHGYSLVKYGGVNILNVIVKCEGNIGESEGSDPFEVFAQAIYNAVVVKNENILCNSQ